MLRQKHKVIVNGKDGWETVMTFREQRLRLSRDDGNPLTLPHW